MQTATPVRTGTCRWVNDAALAFSCGGAAGLIITTKTGAVVYTVVKDDAGYTLTRCDNGKSYRVDTSFGGGPEHFRCSCPDAVRRNALCKHRLALVSGCKALGVEM